MHNTDEEWIDDECLVCREILEENFDGTGMICPECDYERKFKLEEIE